MRVEARFSLLEIASYKGDIEKEMQRRLQQQGILPPYQSWSELVPGGENIYVVVGDLNPCFDNSDMD